MSKKRQKMADATAATTNTIQFERQPKQNFNIVPRNRVQEDYYAALTDRSKSVIFAVGPAGTGKTLMAMMAGVQALRDNQVSRLILTRPAVGADGEEHGFLPGDLNEKMAPWTLPLMDVIRQVYDARTVEKMIAEQIIELAPLSFMRGRNFNSSWIVFDEAQNSTVNQMKMILTRLCEGSKIVITGDLSQKDTPFVRDNGLKDFLSRIEPGDPLISKVMFNRNHVVRSKVVARILDLYGEDE